jgi:mRNA-degrading endonuclease RelE of RelBE toxin-antitoxin system
MKLEIMYNATFTNTGFASWKALQPTEQERVAEKIGKVTFLFEQEPSMLKGLHLLEANTYVLHVGKLLRVVLELDNHTFRVVDVFRYQPEKYKHIIN